MREIKFRGISYETGKWVYGGFCEWSDKTWIIQKDAQGELCEIEVMSETVGQYTEQKDKNDVEIYEGDKVKEDDLIATVTFGQIGYDGCPNGMHGFALDYWYEEEEFFYELRYNFNPDELEVIGNIYEGVKNDSKEI